MVEWGQVWWREAKLEAAAGEDGGARLAQWGQS